MFSPPTAAAHVGIICDALASRGIGHLVRQVALTEELQSRGYAVTFYGQCDVPWAEAQLGARGLEFSPLAEDVASQMRRADVQAVVIDGYEFPADIGRALKDVNIPVMAMADGDFGAHQVANLYVDQNLGTTNEPGPGWLIGPRYVLLRDVVRRLRGCIRPNNQVPRVLIVFGGSDPFKGSPILADLLFQTGFDVEVLAIAASDEAAQTLQKLEVAPGQRLNILPPQNDLPALAASCDFVISAAGSSAWELACVGVPAGLVCVVDNQKVSYEAATRELAVALGELAELRHDESARTACIRILVRLLTDAEWREQLGREARNLIDGDGRQRVVDALEKLIRS